jgi:DNA-binding NarL/FixJ family response regulator
VNCLLVDDHTLFREALALLMSTRHPEVRLHQAARLSEALASLAATADLELVLLDLALPDSQGLATLAALRAAAPMPRVIVLSADDRVETVLAAIDAGAAGFIPKSADIVTLEQALNIVLHRGVFIPPAALLQAGPIGIPAPPPLTPRQTEVLRLLVEGQSNKVIGRVLGLSPSTVRTHVEALFGRFGVHNRTQAVVAAARLGLRL